MRKYSEGKATCKVMQKQREEKKDIKVMN